MDNTSSSRRWPLLFILAGLALMFGLSIAELFGVGKPGFGPKQGMVALAGFWLLAAGVLLAFALPWRRVLTGVCFLLFSLTLAVFAADLWFSRVTERTPPANRSISLREWRPSTDFYPFPGRTWLSDSLEQKVYKFSTDANGFVKPSRVFQDPDIEIVFLGGSTTECMMVDEEARFPAKVGELLRPTFGKVNSYNAGKAGNSSLHSLNVLLNKVIPMEPAIVVMMHNWNELSPLMYGETNWNTTIRGRGVIEVRPDETPGSLLRKAIKTFVPNLQEQVMNRLSSTDEFAAMRERTVNQAIDYDFIHREFRKNLVTFVAICRSRGITPVLMTQQNRLKEEPDELIRGRVKLIEEQFQIDYAGYRALFRSLNDDIREVGAQEGVQVIDLAAAIPPEREFMYDMCHFNTAGSLKAAEFIAGELEPLADR